MIMLMASMSVAAKDLPTSARSEKAIKSVEGTLKQELSRQGLTYGAPIFVRIFKDPGMLEMWIENSQGNYVKFKTYDICSFSGELGPKLMEGDMQSPEGFYFVNPGRLNPWSQFHLSFNLGFPNEYDRYHGRTGSALMVHGNCVSVGCYAMTDDSINEIYALGFAALKNKQPFFRVHVFPFKMTELNMEAHTKSQWYEFWLNLKQAYDYFETYKKPPNVEVKQGQYVFNDAQ